MNGTPTASPTEFVSVNQIYEDMKVNKIRTKIFKLEEQLDQVTDFDTRNGIKLHVATAKKALGNKLTQSFDNETLKKQVSRNDINVYDESINKSIWSEMKVLSKKYLNDLIPNDANRLISIVQNNIPTTHKLYDVLVVELDEPINLAWRIHQIKTNNNFNTNDALS